MLKVVMFFFQFFAFIFFWKKNIACHKMIMWISHLSRILSFVQKTPVILERSMFFIVFSSFRGCCITSPWRTRVGECKRGTILHAMKIAPFGYLNLKIYGFTLYCRSQLDPQAHNAISVRKDAIIVFIRLNTMIMIYLSDNI